MSLRGYIQKLIYKERANSETYLSYLRAKGMKIGADVRVYVPSKTTIDVQYPWMIEIGNHVRIAQGAIILTHDYSWSVLKRFFDEDTKPGAILGSSGKVKIGNNVFIGMNAIITAGVTIGDNVVIGTGSIVTKDCIESGVYVGSPAKKIMEISEFYKKREARQLDEAKTLAVEYYKRFNKKPAPEIFHEYFMLFASYDDIRNNFTFSSKMKKVGNEDESIAFVKDRKPMFNGYEEFLDYCFDEKE